MKIRKRDGTMAEVDDSYILRTASRSWSADVHGSQARHDPRRPRQARRATTGLSVQRQ